MNDNYEKEIDNAIKIIFCIQYDSTPGHGKSLLLSDSQSEEVRFC